MDEERKTCLSVLRQSWPAYDKRFDIPDVADTVWADELDQYLEDQIGRRIEHVRVWIDVNTSRFKADTTNFSDLHREFQNMAGGMKSNVRLCKIQCGSCQLLCLHPRHHEGPHDCQTNHQCPQVCSFVDEHDSGNRVCGMP